jgi:hypothetical protein
MNRPEYVVAGLILSVCLGVFAVLAGVYEYSLVEAGAAAAGLAIIGIIEFVVDESSI